MNPRLCSTKIASLKKRFSLSQTPRSQVNFIKANVFSANRIMLLTMNVNRAMSLLSQIIKGCFGRRKIHKVHQGYKGGCLHFHYLLELLNVWAYVGRVVEE